MTVSCDRTFLLVLTLPCCLYTYMHVHIPYSAKRWQGKTLANRLFQSFGEENVGKINLLALS